MRRISSVWSGDCCIPLWFLYLGSPLMYILTSTYFFQIIGAGPQQRRRSAIMAAIQPPAIALIAARSSDHHQDRSSRWHRYSGDAVIQIILLHWIFQVNLSKLPSKIPTQFLRVQIWLPFWFLQIIGAGLLPHWCRNAAMAIEGHSAANFSGDFSPESPDHLIIIRWRTVKLYIASQVRRRMGSELLLQSNFLLHWQSFMAVDDLIYNFKWT